MGGGIGLTLKFQCSIYVQCRSMYCRNNVTQTKKTHGMSRRPLLLPDELSSDLGATNGNGNVDSFNTAAAAAAATVRKRVNFEQKNSRVEYDDDDEYDDELLQQQQQQQQEDKHQSSELKRRCIDYHTPSVLDVSSRLYRKTNRRSHARPGGSGLAGYGHLQCHANYLKLMGLPCGEGANGGHVVPSVGYLTYCAHVTRAKNSQPVL